MFADGTVLRGDGEAESEVEVNGVEIWCWWRWRWEEDPTVGEEEGTGVGRRNVEEASRWTVRSCKTLRASSSWSCQRGVLPRKPDRMVLRYPMARPV